MLPNLILAVTNLVGILPIFKCLDNDDTITFGILSYMVAISTISHLVENHKHNMPGIGYSKKVSRILNNMDIGMCFITAMRLLFVASNIRYYSLMGITLINIVSGSRSNSRTEYVIYHSMWHILIYLYIYIIL